MNALLERLPAARGALAPMEAMAHHTWFGVGGPAEVMFTPVDRDDLAGFLAGTPEDIPVFAFGAGSNLLVREGGIRGVVVNTGGLGGAVEDEGMLAVGAGLHDTEVARVAARLGFAGLEFLIGIPGTIGGGLRMNAGAYGTEFRDIVVRAEAVDRKGRVHEANPDEMGMAYRHSDAPADWIFTRAWLRTEGGDKDAIRARMKEIIASRADAQPSGVRTGGSTFANPEGGKAWQLIDDAGCRGLANGEAMVSDKHCNFLINKGGATATAIEELGETVRRRVAESSGVDLRWEIQRVGERAAEGGGK